jgi:hypothetical protein
VWLSSIPQAVMQDFARDRNGLPNFRFSKLAVAFYIYCFVLSFRGFWFGPPSLYIFLLFCNNIY